MRRAAFATLLVLLVVSRTSATTLLVPTNYATIQAAVDAATNGDSVVVEPGTYFESVVVPKITITILSQSDDPTDTILDGSSNDTLTTMVYFDGDSTITREIRGFTLRNSHANAIDIDNALFGSSHHIIQNCRFIDNGPLTPLEGSFNSIELLDCEFIDNVGDVFGGAVIIKGAATITGNTFRNNQALPYGGSTLTQGGGIFLFSTIPTPLVEIRDNTFEDNYCNDYGGAIYAFQDYRIVIEDNTFLRNVADICAGAIYVVANKDSCVIANNLFVDNNSMLGSTIAVDLCADGTEIRGNTIVGGVGGAGMLIHDSTNLIVENNIIAFGPSYGIRWLSNPPVTQVSGIQQCNNAFGNPSGDYVITGTMVTSTMNISLDPLFCDTLNGDYTLREDSPCLPANNACAVLMGALGEGCGIQTSVYDPPVVTVRLDQNYPNPFNPVTTMHYSIAEPGFVSLRVYDTMGRLVRTLVNKMQTPRSGGFAIDWDGRNDDGSEASSGVYFYRLETTGHRQTRKMVLLK